MDKATIADLMNLLPEVTWDRCVPGEMNTTVYGWVPRDDGRSDFVVLFAGAAGVGFTTSSAAHSRTFSERLFGTTVGHRECQRVEDVFGDLVAKKVCQVAA